MPISEYIRNLRAKVGHELIMMPSVAAVIRDGTGAVLLQLRGDTGEWSLPGGAIEPGEEPAAALVREVFEETGLCVVPERIVGVYGGPDNVGQYPNGDKIAVVNITFVCRVVGGALHADGDETRALYFFPPEQLPADVVTKHRIRIAHAVTRAEPFFWMPGE